jgi:hypothetical protein
MLSVHLSATRTVQLSSLHIRYFHTPFDEQLPAVDRITELVRQMFPSDGRSPIPIHVADADVNDDKLCIGLFQSAPLSDEALAESTLIVCWKVRNVSGSLRDIVLRGLAGLRWEDHARDFSTWT